MENLTTYYEQEQTGISVSDKLVGVFTEPGSLFTKLSFTKPKVTDWAVPLVLLMILAMTVQFAILQNPVLKQQAVAEQLEKVEAFLAGYVEDGKLSQAQADQQLDAAADRMEQQMDAGLIIGIVSIVVISLIFFFAVSGVYIFIAKFVLKGEGTYKAGLTAYGLAGYILALQLITTIILIMAAGDIHYGTDAAKLISADPQEFAGYLLGYLDPFKIWFYVVVGIAFAKMFKSDSTIKYIATTLGVWLIFGLAFYGLAQVVPFLKLMIR